MLQHFQGLPPDQNPIRVALDKLASIHFAARRKRSEAERTALKEAAVPLQQVLTDDIKAALASQ
jgi:hypothetical protein